MAIPRRSDGFWTKDGSPVPQPKIVLFLRTNAIQYTFSLVGSAPGISVGSTPGSRGGKIMKITDSRGRVFEAALLAQTDDIIRVVIEGANDVTELRKLNAVWVSQDDELVHIQFAWEKKGHTPTVSAADCCCPHELAARLIHLLFNGDQMIRRRRAWRRLKLESRKQAVRAAAAGM
jgi:hypothetical protein